jgi:D-alanyl-D-alanine carboxypeptidase
LSDTVEHWLPKTVPSGSSITVRQLLNHTSGLYDYTEDPRLLEPYADEAGYFWAPLDLLALANSHPPLFKPGSNWSYSNTNYVLLGLIIEAVTGHRASTEVEHRIIEPLHLRDTTLPLRTPHIAGPHTHGYFINLPPEWGVPGGVLDTTTLSPSHAWTAGGMISTVGDLARFHRALFTGHLLRPAQLRELTSVVPGFDYGMGVMRWDTACGTAWGHGGSFPGYYSVSLTSPDGSRQAVIALNSNQFLSDQTYTDLDTTLETAFCGQTPAPGHLPKIRTLDR